VYRARYWTAKSGTCKPSNVKKAAHEQITDSSQAPRAHSSSAFILETTLCGSFLNVKPHLSPLLQSQIDVNHWHQQQQVKGAGWGGKELLDLMGEMVFSERE
jgi:hypothetical protein